MSSVITKAIIPVAGWGTRRLPITKAIEKCMLPIGNRPLIDYIVRDCLQAGITDIYFVISKGDTQIQKYFSVNQDLNTYLTYNGKQDLLPLVTPPQNVNFHYIEQEPNGKYGTAVPVGLCLPYIAKGESVAVMMGDDFIYNADGSSELMRLKEATPQGMSSMLTVQIPQEEVARYGVIQFNEQTNMFEKIVEHPTPEQAPSNYINVSKYILNYDILQLVKTYTDLDISGEYWLIEPINQYVLSGGGMQVVPAKGQYLDGGNVHGWLHANEVVVRAAH
jgi:UTP--glucose-1-phosphate uridylyltransferase